MFMVSAALAIDEKVLVLNRLYTAIRVISARRAFVMLFKQAAEVIAVEDGQYVTYDFESWTEIGELQSQFEPEAHTWV
ncbi:MAG: HNH endonuclease, partial [Planctomycetota bacterium]